MNFEPISNGSPMPEASRKLAGGASHRLGISERGQPRQGRRNDVGRFPQPLPGLTFVVWQGTGGLHHRLISDVPPGQTLSRALKVHDTHLEPILIRGNQGRSLRLDSVSPYQKWPLAFWITCAARPIVTGPFLPSLLLR